MSKTIKVFEHAQKALLSDILSENRCLEVPLAIIRGEARMIELSESLVEDYKRRDHYTFETVVTILTIIALIVIFL